MKDAQGPKASAGVPAGALVAILSTLDPDLVRRAASILAQERIEHLSRGGPLQDPWSGAYVGGEFEVCVRRDDEARARRLLDGLDAAYRRPERSEAAEYYFRYIDQVQGANVLDCLAAQRSEAIDVLRRVPDAKAGFRYAPDKWTLRQVVGHVNDTERLFCARAFWFARGFDSPLPSFDQNVAIAAARFDERAWSDLVDEFGSIRDATVTFFRSLPAEAWNRRGIASDNPFTVRALAYLAAGHVRHHLDIVKTRYLQIA